MMEKNILDSIKIIHEICEYMDSDEDSMSDELRHWLEANPNHRKILDGLFSEESLQRLTEFYDKYELREELLAFRRKRKTVRLRRLLRNTVAAAAVLILGAVFFFFRSDGEPLTPFSGAEIVPVRALAVLELEGERITIDSSMRLSTQGGTFLFDGQGKAVAGFDAGDPQHREPRMRKLIVPRGGEYFMTLPDQTKVWLNAESELIFPEFFTEQQREVVLRGEAYFEVSPESDRMFRVGVTDDLSVIVHGTSFNVRNYGNENTASVSLLEGAVTMYRTATGQSVDLQPRKQYGLDKISGESYVADIKNPYAVRSWTRNVWVFDNEKLDAIARTLERWYDVTIEVDDPLRGYVYSGVISRQRSMEAILDVVRYTGEVEVVQTAVGSIKFIPVRTH